MYLFIDETENNDFFIVTGLLVKSKEDVVSAYNHFKKSISNIPISSREKSILFTEFKATLLDRKYKKIKFKLLEELSYIKPIILYSCFNKKDLLFTQKIKEDTYLKLLSKIIMNINDRVNVIFDLFNKKDFEEKIINKMKKLKNIESINGIDSHLEEGLQFIDNLCSVIRLHKSNLDKYNFYAIIEKFIIQFD